MKEIEDEKKIKIQREIEYGFIKAILEHCRGCRSEVVSLRLTDGEGRFCRRFGVDVIG